MLVLGFAGVVVLLRPSVGGGQEWPALVACWAAFLPAGPICRCVNYRSTGRAGLAGGVLFIAGGHGDECAVGMATGWHSLSWQAAPYLFASVHRRWWPALPHARL